MCSSFQNAIIAQRLRSIVIAKAAKPYVERRGGKQQEHIWHHWRIWKVVELRSDTLVGGRLAHWDQQMWQ